MAISKGVFRQLAYKAETTYGTAPSASGAQLLRRVQTSLNLTKDTYQSNEIRSDFQMADFRHGTRRVAGNISGEVSAGSYADFFAALLRRNFAAVNAITGLSLTIATTTAVGGRAAWTVTRGSGSFLTDGVKIGDIIRLSAGTFNAANASKNLLVVALTATVATVIPLNGVALVAEGPIASSTVTVTGKKTYTPVSGHTDKSFAIEQWFSDNSLSEVYLGCKVGSAAINLPTTGIATVDLAFTGQGVTTAGSRYFTSPTAATSSGVMAAVNGLLLVNGTPSSIVTGMQINIEGNLTGDPVVGSNVIPEILPGRVMVSGQFTAFFDSGTYRDLFIDETEIALLGVFSASNAADSDFVSFVMPRVKLGGASRDDGDKGIVQTLPFQALFNSTGGSGVASEQTTLVMQDSQAA